MVNWTSYSVWWSFGGVVLSGVQSRGRSPTEVEFWQGEDCWVLVVNRLECFGFCFMSITGCFREYREAMAKIWQVTGIRRTILEGHRNPVRVPMKQQIRQRAEKLCREEVNEDCMDEETKVIVL
ncbi:hypothetical protein ACLB2K_037697 [Fragaria x ananassa]